MTASGVWADLVGQDKAVATLKRAVAGEPHAMSHAWLFTGPPGSGRSNAAVAFAAALQCDSGGCGVCTTCRTVLAGTHPDVTIVRTEMLSIGVDEVRELARRSAMAPSLCRYQVLVIEDADRVTERGADALLKSIEEPAPRTVWLLCAPTPDDVVVTVRSRCRRVELSTPTEADVARVLQSRDGVDAAMAAFAARLAQGHIGRARALALREDVRIRRSQILALPRQLTSLGACIAAAATLVSMADEEAKAVTDELDARETAELREALGFGATGTKPRNAQAAIKDLEDQQKARRKRLQRDSLDRVLTEFTSYYRDVLAVQFGTSAHLINAELAASIESLARRTTAEQTTLRLDALLVCRRAIETNVASLLALEALLIELAEI